MQKLTQPPQAAQMGRIFPIEDTRQAFDWFTIMRETQPVYQDARGLWHVFRYDDVQRALSDYAQFSSSGLADMVAGDLLSDTVVTTDPPEHRKLRNLVNLAFTPRVLEQLTDQIVQICQQALDVAVSHGQSDAVAEIAFPVPAKAIAAVLGIPDKDWDIFRRWVAGPDPGDQTRGESRLTGQTMYNYFMGLLTTRQQQPQGDVLSMLSVAEVDGVRLSESDLVKFCILLLAAGQETTKNLIANTIYLFTEYPELQSQLRPQPDLIPAAIEEILRYAPPVWYTFRRTTTAVEIGERVIPANAIVQVWNASANHDPRIFPDPERLDIHRTNNRHLSFGHGIHYCLGAPLARLEARVLLPMMLEQLRDIQRVSDTPVLVHAGVTYVIQLLPISFQPHT